MVTPQRLLAALLTLIFVLAVLAVFVLVFKAAGHTGWGYVAGLLFIALSIFGFVRERRRQP